MVDHSHKVGDTDRGLYLEFLLYYFCCETVKFLLYYFNCEAVKFLVYLLFHQPLDRTGRVTTIRSYLKNLQFYLVAWTVSVGNSVKMSTFSVPRKNNWVNSQQQQRSHGSSSGFAQQPFEDLMNWGQIRVSLMASQYATGITTTRNPKYRPPSIATKLVTIKSLHTFGRFTHWISFIGGTPFVWNAQRLKFDFYSRWQQKIVYFVMKVISMLYAVYLVLRLIHLNMYTDETFVHKVTHFMWTSAFLLIAVVNWNLIRQAEAVLDFINQFVFTVNLFEGVDLEFKGMISAQ